MKSETAKIPNPGSIEAINARCLCPPKDNSFGKGYLGQEKVFVYQTDCPVHFSALANGVKGQAAYQAEKARAADCKLCGGSGFRSVPDPNGGRYPGTVKCDHGNPELGF